MTFGSEPEFDLSPVGSLALLWPAVPEGLVGSAARSALEAAASRLAPIARLAIELRLGEGRDDVDLHQYVSGSAADAAVLRRYLTQMPEASQHPHAIGRFLQAWADDEDSIRTDLGGVFLEWDMPGSGTDRAPALFLPVETRHDRGPQAGGGRHRVARHAHRLKLAGDHVTKLLSALPPDLSISYIGFMLGRGEAVRVNLRGVRPDDLKSLLSDLGWPGECDRATDLFARLVGITGRVAIGLDFAPAIRPTIGFEAMLPDFPALEPRWSELLDWLCAENICTNDQRTALERVGARLYPEDSRQDWPASWIAAAVRAPPKFVPWFERRLSHVKVSLGADSTTSAKAYISAQHQWSRNNLAASPRSITADGPAAAIAAAAASAVGFLLAERDQDDFWRDFQIVNGASDEWVTAFVGYALVVSGADLPDTLIAQTIRAMLRRQRPAGGWGYNRISPGDADSTAWALKFFRAVGYSGPDVACAEAFLGAHLQPGGAVATYAPDTPIRFDGSTGPQDDAGWRSGHACVAANVAALMGETVSDHLRSSQNPDGAWTAYWWRNDNFATALAAEAVGPGPNLSRAIGWATTQAATRSSPFDRAWLIRILMLGQAAERAQAHALAFALAAEQQSDGGWNSSAEMLFPDPATLSRQPNMAVMRDTRRLFTAASALLALSAAQASDIAR